MNFISGLTDKLFVIFCSVLFLTTVNLSLAYGLDQLSFLERVDANFPGAEAPDETVLFRWDFSKKQNLSYTYIQETESEFRNDTFSEMSGEDEEVTRLTGEGELIVKSNGDNTADVVLKNLNIVMDTGDGKNMEQSPPPSVMQGMAEDGAFEDSSAASLMKILFPLPSKPLEVGQSVDIPMKEPFRALGSILWVKGRARITLTRYVSINGHTSARFDTDIDVSELDIPDELEGEYFFSMKGKSVFFFDIENRRFDQGSATIYNEVHVSQGTPDVTLGGEEVKDIPKTFDMGMKSNEFFSVELVGSDDM